MTLPLTGPLTGPMPTGDLLAHHFVPTDHIVESCVGDETVLLHLENSTYYGFDAIGTKIWTGLKAGEAPHTICAALAAAYAVPLAQVEDDARGFLTELLGHAMVVAR